MNANELADELENKPLAYGDDIQTWLCEASTMLRQQQAEIEALKNILAEVDRQTFAVEIKDDGTMTPVIRMEKP